MKIISVKEFENINMFNNENVQKILTNTINEASNAALVSVFDESVIILDTENKTFQKADFSFSRDDMTLALENFEELGVVESEDRLNEEINNLFES